MSVLKVPTRRRGRPPLDSTYADETRNSIIWAGLELLTEKGVTATGIDQILRKVDIPKGSFYHYFKSKDAFLEEVISAYNNYFIRKLKKYFEDSQHLPLTRLRNFTEDAKISMARYKFKRGCLIGNMGQETASLNKTLRKKIEASLIDWESLLEECLKDAVETGELPSDTNCAVVASYFWIGWEGAVLRSKLCKDIYPLELFTNQFIANLECKS
jgi:TetR/AcrR family transcriptional repressor of nem operon